MLSPVKSLAHNSISHSPDPSSKHGQGDVEVQSFHSSDLSGTPKLVAVVLHAVFASPENVIKEKSLQFDSCCLRTLDIDAVVRQVKLKI